MARPERARHFDRTSSRYSRYLVFDNMLGDNGDSLTVRDPEKGGPWTDVDDGLVTDGTGYCDSNAAITGLSVIPAAADCWVRLYCLTGGASDPNSSMIVFNYLDANNYWKFGQFFNLCLLVKKVGGFDSNVYLSGGKTWGGAGTPHELKIQRSGNTIRMFIDGVQESTDVTDADLKTATGVGIASIRNALNYWRFDKLTAALTDI